MPETYRVTIKDQKTGEVLEIKEMTREQYERWLKTGAKRDLLRKRPRHAPQKATGAS
jgi:hypothetical protein